MAATSKNREKKRFITPVFRASFLNVFKPRAFEEGMEPKYGVTAVWTLANMGDKDKDRYKAIIAEVKRACHDDMKVVWPNGISGNFRGIHDGALKADLEGFGEGTRFANLQSIFKPGVVDIRSGADIGPDFGNTELIYPGCYMRATVSVYTYGPHTKAKSKGVNLSLFNLQLIKDGPRLDNRVAAADDFDDDIDAEWMDEKDDAGDADGDDDFN